MKKVTLVFLLSFATFAWAAAEPNPEEYATNVHVSSSRLVVEVPNGIALDDQVLNVVINGKKYELSRPVPCEPGLCRFHGSEPSACNTSHRIFSLLFQAALR